MLGGRCWCFTAFTSEVVCWHKTVAKRLCSPSTAYCLWSFWISVENQMKTKVLLVCWKLWRWIYFTPWDLWSAVTMLTILTIFGNFVAMMTIFLPKSEVQCLCLHTGQSHSRKGLGMTCFRASLALVINSYCVGAVNPSQALLLFYWCYSAP